MAPQAGGQGVFGRAVRVARGEKAQPRPARAQLRRRDRTIEARVHACIEAAVRRGMYHQDSFDEALAAQGLGCLVSFSLKRGADTRFDQVEYLVQTNEMEPPIVGVDFGFELSPPVTIVRSLPKHVSGSFLLERA